MWYAREERHHDPIFDDAEVLDTNERAQERAQERAEEWSRSLSSGWRAQASGEGVESRRVGGALVTERRREESSLEDPREAAQRRDAYLLGFAALALGAAVGVARRRREQVA